MPLASSAPACVRACVFVRARARACMRLYLPPRTRSRRGFVISFAPKWRRRDGSRASNLFAKVAAWYVWVCARVRMRVCASRFITSARDFFTKGWGRPVFLSLCQSRSAGNLFPASGTLPAYTGAGIAPRPRARQINSSAGLAISIRLSSVPSLWLRGCDHLVLD